MVKLDRKTWKGLYFHKINKYMSEFSKCIIVGVDNVQSKQMQSVRAELRGRAELLMGKNTLIRKALRDMITPDMQSAEGRWYEGEPKPEFETLLPFVVGNIGFCFTNMDVAECRNVLLANKVQAPAKAGIVAPLDVFVEAGPTGLDAQKTSFFQALNLPTKIARGIIEMISRIKIVNEGEKVGLSEAKLLNMLNVSPFFYGITVDQIYEGGEVYPSSVLDITQSVLLAKFAAGLKNVAAIGLATGYPTSASVYHSIMNGFKNVLCIAAAADIKFPQADLMHAYLADPSAFQGGGGGGGGGDAAPAAAAAAPAPEKEESEEEDMDMDMDLFD